jgi:hypothetical protein
MRLKLPRLSRLELAQLHQKAIALDGAKTYTKRLQLLNIGDIESIKMALQGCPYPWLYKWVSQHPASDEEFWLEIYDHLPAAYLTPLFEHLLVRSSEHSAQIYLRMLFKVPVPNYLVQPLLKHKVHRAVIFNLKFQNSKDVAASLSELCVDDFVYVANRMRRNYEALVEVAVKRGIYTILDKVVDNLGTEDGVVKFILHVYGLGKGLAFESKATNLGEVR